MKFRKTLLVFLFFWTGMVFSAEARVAEQGLASALQRQLQLGLHDLRPVKRGGLALRLYRLSGDAQYAKQLDVYVKETADTLKKYVRHLDQPGFAEKMGRELLDAKRPSTPETARKLAERKKYFADKMAAVFERHLLFLTYQAHEMGLHHDPGFRPIYRKALVALKKSSWKKRLFDPQTIRVNSTRTSNGIFYLQAIGLGDHEKKYIKIFKQVFFNHPDSKFDDFAYLNKLYGMTHFIIAGSGFYQHHVDPEKYAWIYDYFSENQEMILKRGGVDLLAEIAVCFKLADLGDDPFAKRLRQYLAEHIYVRNGHYYLLDRRSDFRQAKHRHVLTWMAFADLSKLQRGPEVKLH